jgi:hypothetical protein
MANSICGWPAVAGFSITLIGVHSMCLYLLVLFFALISFNTNRNKTYFKSKIGEPIMESLKEGVKFVFNKTILGALSLDMVAVLFMEQWHFTYFAQDILKVGPEGFGVLRAVLRLGRF